MDATFHLQTIMRNQISIHKKTQGQRRLTNEQHSVTIDSLKQWRFKNEHVKHHSIIYRGYRAGVSAF